MGLEGLGDGLAGGGHVGTGAFGLCYFVAVSEHYWKADNLEMMIEQRITVKFLIKRALSNYRLRVVSIKQLFIG